MSKFRAPQHFPQARGDGIESDPLESGGNDSFTKSSFVHGLKWDTFGRFINNKDVALVMFYNTKEPRCLFCRPRFVQAAETTVRENHAYAAVNCRAEGALCAKENVDFFPTFRLYSKGHSVSTVTDFKNFDAETMKRFVENSPLHRDTRVKRPLEKTAR